MLSADEEADFWVFYHKTSESLFRKAYRMCRGHRADADDAHQRAYLQALVHWPTVGGLADPQRRSRLVRTLTNEVLQIWRAPHRSRETGSYDDAAGRLGVPADVDAVSEKDRFYKACQAIAQLEGRQRDVIALHCLAGYEISQVAEMLEISTPTARVHLHKGRLRLRMIMAGEEDTADGAV